MASVTQQTEFAPWIDRSLDYLTNEWAAVPAVAADWDRWDEADRLDFALEWPIREDRLGQLERWNLDGLLTPLQRQRYEKLQRLVSQHRSLLERLLSD